MRFDQTMPAPRDRPHILLPGPSRTEAYRARPRKVPRRRPAIVDPETHARRLLSRFDRAVRQSRTVAGAAVEALAQRRGLLIEVRGFPGFEVALESLHSRRIGGIELRAVQKTVSPDGIEIVRAVVYVPFGQVGRLRKKIENYLSGELSPRGHRKNKDLIESIQDFDQAVLRSLWTENEPFPREDELIWWEVWLRRPATTDEDSTPLELERFRAAAERAGLSIRLSALLFADRVVVVTHGDRRGLASAFERIDDLAELRRARETAAFFRALPASAQMEFIQDLLDRSSFPGEAAPAVCVLDTGVNRGHALLAPALADSNLLSCRGWPSHDDDGHGTEMAGLALYGDLVGVFDGSGPVDLRHRLESVKILPPRGLGHPADHDGPELWGAITAEACARAEMSAPDRQRCFSMAVTAGPTDRGQPTSWSAAVDALAAGRQVTPTTEGLELARGDREYRLFVISSGNLPLPGPPHPDNSDSALVQDPGQAWNVLTAGAYTERAVIEEEDYQGWSALAAPGDLSPHSTTSVGFDASWPIKPEVVLEGGNVAVDASNSERDSGVPSLCLLSTSATPQISPLEISSGTSAACALTARLAACLAADHPEFWPETLRALVVHSARWTPAMRSAFDAVGARKRRRSDLLRRYGYGVPDLARATRSATDAVTLIAQATIRPYVERRMREMHLYQLPWPTETLLDLGGRNVQLRVTLSYFIEPNPGRRGWAKRFRYASHGLRFEIKGATEEPSDFRWRLNEQARLEDEGTSSQKPPDQGWFLGEAGQTKGSIHSDCWEGPAVELARRGLLAIYPVSGWWKELLTPDRSNEGVRYSLVVSIETDEEEVDLWTPVALQLEVPIEIS